MKNTKKYLRKKNKYSRKYKKKIKKNEKNEKNICLMKGGGDCIPPPSQIAEESECKRSKKNVSECLAAVKEKYSEKPDKCNPYTCCSDKCSPDLCEPWQDIVSNGIYPPIKWTYDTTTGTMIWVVGGMFHYSATGILSGMVSSALDTFKSKLPEITKAINDAKKNINTSIPTNLPTNLSTSLSTSRNKFLDVTKFIHKGGLKMRKTRKHYK